MGLYTLAAPRMSPSGMCVQFVKWVSIMVMPKQWARCLLCIEKRRDDNMNRSACISFRSQSKIVADVHDNKKTKNRATIVQSFHLSNPDIWCRRWKLSVGGRELLLIIVDWTIRSEEQRPDRSKKLNLLFRPDSWVYLLNFWLSNKLWRPILLFCSTNSAIACDALNSSDSVKLSSFTRLVYWSQRHAKT